jgi:hypothetical protein
MIQSLERRMLMSVTAATLSADVSNVFTDAAAAMTAHSTRHTAAHNDIQAIVLDLKGLDTKLNRAANNKLAATLVLEGDITHLRIVVDQAAFLTTAKIDSLLGEVFGKGLLNHPTSTAFAKLVANEITNLNTKVPAKLTTLQTELTTATNTFDANLNAIAAANPSLSSLVTSFETDVAAKTAAYSTAAGAVATDTSQLATDLAAIPT